MKNKKNFILAAIALLLAGSFVVKPPHYARASFGAWVSYVANTFNFNVQGSALVAQEFNYTQISQNNTTTTVKTSPGLLHSITLNTEATGSVITAFDTTSTTILPQVNASGTITIGSSSSATSTASGTLTAVVNGFTITSGVVGVASTSVQAATLLTTAINASSSILNFVTATSSNNVITLTEPNLQPGLFTSLSLALSQLGFTNTSTFSLYSGTPIIAKITLPATLLNQGPQTALYDIYYTAGLLITQTGGTSTLTISSY